MTAALVHAQGVPTCQCNVTTGEPPCCTYTIGWWRNHHKNKPAAGPQFIPWPTPCPGPLDDGEDSVVFGGIDALTIMQTPGAGGDKCYGLGHQFIGATMNECKGACTDATVAQALTDAYALLTTTSLCPGGLTPAGNATLRAQAVVLEDILEGYNSGDEFGPGHCDDEAPEECPQFDCVGNCTRTQGYWKTHNGEVKNRDPWSTIEGCPHDEDDILYYGLSWYAVLSTPPKGGDACLIAGKQFVAAKLNINCLGACVPPLFVADALTCVQDKLNSSYCPGLTPGVAQLTEAEKVARTELLTCSRTLDAYNNGFLLGPGNCDSFEEADDGGNNEKKPKIVEEVTLTSSQDSGITIAILVIVVVICLLAAFTAWYAMIRTKNAKRRFDNL